MSMHDRLVFGLRLARALADVGTDALADPFGRALPLTPAPWTDPARFERLMREAAVSPWPGSARPARIRCAEAEAESSNCRNTTLALEWPAASGGGALPGSVFVKQPSGDRATRVFANLIGFWKTECAFCRSLAGALPIPSPRIFAVMQRRSRFVIAMEDLRERPDTRLFVNRALLAGADLELARRGVRTLARLHAGFEGWPAARREAALPLALHPYLSPALQPIMLAVNRLAIPRCLERSHGLFRAREAELAKRALANLAALRAAWYRGPLTLVHGDSHLGNFFETRGELGMLDFQGAHWGRGARDLQYFLVNSMSPSLLARHERSLVDAYADESARRGAPVDADAVFDEYRGFSFQTLMTAVVSLGLGSFTDSEAVMRAMLERSVAAIERLGFADWLDRAIAAFEPDRPGHVG